MNRIKIMEYTVALTIAFIISMIVFLMASSLLINSAIASVQDQFNNMKLVCSETPFLNSSEIIFKGEKIYCAINPEITPITEDWNAG